METNAEGTYFQEGDHLRIKRTAESGRVNATDGGVVYVLMDGTNETRLFSARADEDASIELVTPEAEETMLERERRSFTAWDNITGQPVQKL
jgi:hypothetical protein